MGCSARYGCSGCFLRSKSRCSSQTEEKITLLSLTKALSYHLVSLISIMQYTHDAEEGCKDASNLGNVPGQEDLKGGLDLIHPLVHSGLKIFEL